MNTHPALKVIIPLVLVLAGFAAAMGLFYETPGTPYAFVSVQGEQVTIRGHGLYTYDTISSAAQMQANDLVALVLGTPLLILAALTSFRASPGSAARLRGQLLLSGTLGFFFYTYMSMAMNTAFNFLFPVYVILFALTLYGLILSMISFDLKALPQRFSERLPRRAIAGLLIAAAAFLVIAWGGRISTPLLQGTPPALENGTTMVIQAMDLALVAPLAVLSAVLLLRRSAWGYLLASVAVLKFVTMGIAVSTMGINMALQGVPDSLALVGIFIVITLVNLVLAGLLMKNIRQA